MTTADLLLAGNLLLLAVICFIYSAKYREFAKEHGKLADAWGEVSDEYRKLRGEWANVREAHRVANELLERLQ